MLFTKPRPHAILNTKLRAGLIRMDGTNRIVIVGIARTPIGDLLGKVSALSAPELGSIAIESALERSKLDSNAVTDVIMGCVVTAGLGQAVARQAALGANLANSVNCLTINKVCGSGMQAVMLAYDSLLANPDKVIIAGGCESMSNAPFVIPKLRSGIKYGHQQLVDALARDGLEDAYSKQAMGVYAEATAQKFQFSRADQDEFALNSLTKARSALEQGLMQTEFEITPVTVSGPKGQSFTVEQDEHPFNVNPDKISKLRPAFDKNGTVTAANSSAISDGACAMVLTTEAKAKSLGLTPLAVIEAYSAHSNEPEWFTTAPVNAIKKLLTKVDWQQEQVDLYEINEAFAVVTMAACHELSLPLDKVNIHGGACALGHPIGASGARIISTLVNALKGKQLERGLAAVCIGGGEATALAISNLN